MTRPEMLARIAAIEKEVNTEMPNTKLPDSGQRKPFPTTGLILTAALIGFYLAGDQLPYGGAQYQAQYGTYAMYGGVLFGAWTAWNLLQMVLFQPGAKVTPAYREATERVQALQTEKRQLQEAMKNAE